jgi:hypothetical protein
MKMNAFKKKVLIFKLNKNFILTLYVSLSLQTVSEYVANIYERGVEFDHDVRDRNYDILIVSPGK